MSYFIGETLCAAIFVYLISVFWSVFVSKLCRPKVAMWLSVLIGSIITYALMAMTFGSSSILPTVCGVAIALGIWRGRLAYWPEKKRHG